MERTMSLFADVFANANREKLVYTANTHTNGRREGGSCGCGGRLDIDLSISGVPGGSTNREHLFAAGWSASFEGAMAVVARKKKTRLPTDTAIDVEVDLNQYLADNTSFLRALIRVRLPNVERKLALAIVTEAHQICPYSRATRGNIDVAIYLI